MPGAMKYRDPNDTLRPSGITSYNSERAERAKKFDEREKYYYGKQKTFLDLKDGEPDDNVVINLTGQIIDRTLTFLFPVMPTLILDPDVPDTTPEEQWLEDLWNSNGGLSLLYEMAFNGAIGGHGYMRVIPMEAGDMFPQILALDPRRVVTYWKTDNKRRVMWHEISWEADGDKYLLDVINEYETKRWVLRQWKSVNGSQWERDGDDEVWKSPIPPLVHYQHLPNPNQFYGLPEVADLQIQDKLNLNASENMRIIRYYASPKTVATGVDAEDIQPTAVDSMFAIANEKAQVYNLEMKSELQASMRMLEILHSSMLATNRTVIVRGEVKDFQRVTNAGVRTVFLDPLSKNIILRDHYGRAIQQICRAAAYAAGKPDMLPTIIHADPLPMDDLERVNIAAIERSMNTVSRQIVATERGRHWPTVVQNLEAESKLEFLVPPKPEAAGNSDLAPNVKKENA